MAGIVLGTEDTELKKENSTLMKFTFDWEKTRNKLNRKSVGNKFYGDKLQRRETGITDMKVAI